MEKYLSARFSDRWESLLAGRDSTEETFGECEDLLVTLESSMTPRDKLDLLKEAGYTEKVDMVLKYTILENWRAFRESGFDGELTEEENWSVFWSLNDTSGTDYGDICDFEQTIGDLPEDLPYSTYSGLTLLQFAETLYGDSPFPVLIRMLQKQLGTATLFDTALWYFSQQISAEYQRAQADREYFDFLERIKETRRERNSDSYEELFMFERITEAEELILGENALESREDSYRDYSDRIIAMTSLMANRESELTRLKREKDLMSHSLTRYKEQVVDSHFQDIQFHNELYGQQSEALEQIRQDYQTALAEYQSCRSALDTSYSIIKSPNLNCSWPGRSWTMPDAPTNRQL